MMDESPCSDSSTPKTKSPECRELLRCKTLWLGIAAIFLNLGAWSIVLAPLMKWVADLPQAYITNTVQGIGQNFIEVFGITFITWLSEPKRLGRKFAYLILCGCTSVTLIAVCIAGEGDNGAWAFLICKTILSVVGGGNPQGAPYSVLCAWLTDYLPEHLLTAGFSILLGANFLTNAIVSPVSSVIKSSFGLSDLGLLIIAAVVGTVQIPIMFVLSARLTQHSATLLPLAAADNADGNEDLATPTENAAASGLQEISAALRWIFRERFAVAIIWFCINFYAAADSSNLVLFETKGLNFTELQVNLSLTSMGVAGLPLTLIIVPLMSRVLPRSVIVFVGTVASVANCLVLSFATTPSVIIPLNFLAAMSFTCIPTLLSYMKGSNVASQGALIGAFYGVAAVGKTVGPPVLALCLQSYVNDAGLCYVPHTSNFVGAGFVILAAAMSPALVASIYLLLKECRSPKNLSMRDGIVSLQPQRQTS